MKRIARAGGLHYVKAQVRSSGRSGRLPLDPGGNIMAWTTPTLVEICIGLEINGYLPAEF